MIKPLHDDVLNMSLEIEPMPDPVVEEIEEEETKETPVLSDSDIFKGDNTPEIAEEEPQSLQLEVKEKKKSGAKKAGGTGKRGKDTKPRKAWVMTEKRAAHLHRAREASVLKRTALKEEKAIIKAEIKARAEANLTKPVTIKDLTPPPPPKPTRVAPSAKAQDDHFFNLMDRWEEKKQVKKAQRKQNKKETTNHPASTSIPKESRPASPKNPFNEIFNYTNNRSTFW